jgi:hypothetical protein
MSKKNYVLFLFLFLVLMDLKLVAQRIKGEVIAGMNLSQVDGDEVYGFHKAGLNAGLGAILPLGKNFSFTIETLFNQKGSYQGKQYEDTVTNPSTGNKDLWTGEYKMKLDYLEVPVLFHYTDKEIITAGVGFSYGRLVNVKEYEHGRQVETTTLNGGPYDRNDYDVLIDFNFRVHKKIPRFKMNVRYAYSMSKIRTRTFLDKFGNETSTRDQYNNLFSLRLIYVFNEQPPLADQKK